MCVGGMRHSACVGVRRQLAGGCSLFIVWVPGK